MTDQQIEEFCSKRASFEAMEIKAKEMAYQASEELTKNRLSCDHRHPSGRIAGNEFQGSYCGFICQICGCSVSYEKMGY